MIPNDEIDRVAVLMCEELGLNPGEYVTAEYGADQVEPYKSPPPSITIGIAGNNVRVPTFMDNSCGMERWRTLRPAAARAIAGWRAVNTYYIAEK